MKYSILDPVTYDGAIYFIIHRPLQCNMYIFESHCIMYLDKNHPGTKCLDIVHRTHKNDKYNNIIITLHDIDGMICGTITWDIYSAIFPEYKNCEIEKTVSENIKKLLDKNIKFSVKEITICNSINRQNNIRKMCPTLYFGILIGHQVHHKRIGFYNCVHHDKDKLLKELVLKYEDTEYDLSKASVTTMEPSYETVCQCSLL